MSPEDRVILENAITQAKTVKINLQIIQNSISFDFDGVDFSLFISLDVNNPPSLKFYLVESINVLTHLYRRVHSVGTYPTPDELLDVINFWTTFNVHSS